jgi:hypothetical protein
MKRMKLHSAASVTILALGCATVGLGVSAASAQDYGAPPPPPSYAPPPPDYRPPNNYGVPDRSILKVCKVAQDIPVGDMFTYYTEPQGGKKSVMVPAGPAPLGYCQVMGDYPTGSQVTLREFIPQGYSVVSIRTAPAAAEVSQNVADGSVRLKLGRGVTEVTIVNTGTGWIEICKDGGRRGTMYSFSFNAIINKVVTPVTRSVLAGACTPADEVPAGPLVVTEANGQGQMTGGKTWPANRLINAETAQGRLTVHIPPGDLAGQTIITFENREQGGNY